MASTHLGGVRCGIVWDGGTAIADGRVVFAGAKVARVGRATDVPAPPDELDLRPRFCMPGFVDAHVHLTSYAHERADDSDQLRRTRATANARATLQAGVTSARDLGGDGGGSHGSAGRGGEAPPIDVWLAGEIDRGALPGPRLQIAHRQIGNGGELGGPDAARDAVDADVADGATVIKLFVTGGAGDPTVFLTEAEIAAAVQEAHAKGRRVAVHAITRDGIELAIAGGVDSIEHGDELTVDQARRMAARGIVLTPTLYILRYYVEDGKQLGFSAEDIATLQALVVGPLAAFERRLPAIRAAGVQIAMGSDAFMGLDGRNLYELGYLVRAGMTPEQALIAGTRTSAAVMGWQAEVGTLAPGAFADLVAMPGDPRLRIDRALHLDTIIQGGVTIPLDRGTP